MRIDFKLALLAALSGPLVAQACLCSPWPEGMTEAQMFESHWPVIVEADFISVTVTLEHGDPIESGVMRVNRSFKGRFKVGDLIRTRTNTSGAACGYSLRGPPPAEINVVDKTTGQIEPYRERGGYNRWVLFLSGSAPFQVDTCSPSLPSRLFERFPELLRLQKGAPRR